MPFVSLFSLERFVYIHVIEVEKLIKHLNLNMIYNYTRSINVQSVVLQLNGVQCLKVRGRVIGFVGRVTTRG